MCLSKSILHCVWVRIESGDGCGKHDNHPAVDSEIKENILNHYQQGRVTIQEKTTPSELTFLLIYHYQDCIIKT